MLEDVATFLEPLGVPLEAFLLAGAALGAFLLFVGIASAVTATNPAADRLAATGQRKRTRADNGLLKSVEDTPSGLMRSFVPTDETVRSNLRRRLERAGIGGKDAILKFMLRRVGLAIALPLTFIAVLTVARSYPDVLPAVLSGRLLKIGNVTAFQIVTILVAVGYFAPAYRVNRLIEARKLRIQEAFPNALDLLRVSLEAGLAFDASMTRVGNELSRISPDIAYEFLAVQLEVQAGRERERALRDMADRIDLEFVTSFANVVRQSMQFGTNMTEALTVYAEELRRYRETKAQEMANKLPVKMSGVLAFFMLPALVILCLGPVIIRYTNTF